MQILLRNYNQDSKYQSNYKFKLKAFALPGWSFLFQGPLKSLES